jgi:hypothetical protein
MIRLTMKEKLTRIDGKLVKLKAGARRKRKKREGKRVYGEKPHQTRFPPEKAHLHQDLIPVERQKTGIFRN